MTPVQTHLRSGPVQEATRALQRGQFVLVYDADGREEETDLVVASEFVTPDTVANLRTEAGGLICTTIHPRVHQAIGLPYMSDVLTREGRDNEVVRRLVDAHIPYEGTRARSSFALGVNHRAAYTGITDHDRALTIQAVAEISEQVGRVPDADAQRQFAETFRAPGHVFLLNAAPRLLHERKGHTELATALVEMAGLAPTATICETVGGPKGRALPKSEAVKYAARNGLVFLEGHEVLSEWLKATAKPA